MRGLGALLVALAGAGVLAAPAAGTHGQLFVTNWDPFGANQGIIRVDPATGVRTAVSFNGAPAGGPSFNQPTGLGLDAAGRLLVANTAAPSILRVDPVSGARTTVTSNTAQPGAPSLSAPYGVAVEASGDILVADAGYNGVIRVDPLTGARTRLSRNGAPAGPPRFVSPTDIAVTSTGRILVVDLDAFGGSGGVIEVDPATGARTRISRNTAPAGAPLFDHPRGIPFDGVGAPLPLADDAAFGGTGGLIGVDTTTGARTTLSENAAPVGPPDFDSPYDVAIEADGDRVVVDQTAFGGPGGVIRVDAAGTRTRVSENGAPVGGPSFAAPWSIVIGRLTLRAVRFDPFGDDDGGVFRFSLGHAARVTFTIERRLGGGRHRRVGSFVRLARRGANRVRFPARLGGRRLPPGRYRATLRARSRSAGASLPVSLELRG